MGQDTPLSVDEVTLSRGEDPAPVPVVTTRAPVREDQSLYISTGGRLYALNAADGTARWCQQVALTREQQFRAQLARLAREHSRVSYPPPPRARFATPRAVRGAVYVCVEGRGAYTYAFNADDGSLRWRTPTDGRVASMPLLDYAVPLVNNGVVYSGTYALNARDGAVRWRTDVDTSVEGTLSLHALADETIYATTQRGVYAINVQDRRLRWLYEPDELTIVSGPPVVAGRMLVAGANGSVGYPEKSYFFALDVATGADVWRYPNPMGCYIGAATHDRSIYVSSGDRFLYALDAESGRLRWRRQFPASALSSAASAGDILYVTIGADGVYALRSEDGAILWRQPLGNTPGVRFSFYPPFVLDGAVYVVRSDKRGKCALYALDAQTGAECWRWQTSPPSAIAPLAAAQ